ncbi:MAG TPA: M24 family metallopeptidase [Conexibacter sp.]|nr:M24 family metallopeptidase [Conexibacter sp.]
MTVTTLPAPPPAISHDEFAARRARAVALARDAGLDGLLVWGSRNWPWAVRYLADHQSGFMQQGANATTFGDKGFSVLVLPVAGEPILVLDQRVRPGEVAIADARTGTTITPAVAQALRETGLAGGRIGIVGEGALLARQQREVEEALGAPLSLTPADRLIEPLARVKSPAEQELLRYASLVGGTWMETMMAAAAPGLTEGDLVSIGLPVLIGAGGWPMDVVAGSGNPARPQAERGIPSFNARRPFAVGDLLRVDGFGPVAGGYQCDLARSTCVGAEPTAEQREVLEQAVELIDTLIAALRPGVTLGAVHDVGVEFLTSRGHPPHGYFEGFWPAFGHQIGLSTEGPFVSEGETAVVEPGMAMALEIVVGTPATGGISHEECVIVHADRVEVITAGCRQRWW